MKKTALNILVGIALLGFTSCSVSGPLFVTDNPGGKDSKTGEASFTVYLGFIRPMHADVSIRAAAKDGGITKVSTVDQKVTGKFFSTTYTTVVTGE